MPSDFLSNNAPRFLKVEEEFRKQQVDHKICQTPILKVSCQQILFAAIQNGNNG